MKRKLNYTIEVGSKLTILFINYFFILRIRERKLARWFLDVENFLSMYLAAGSFVFA